MYHIFIYSVLYNQYIEYTTVSCLSAVWWAIRRLEMDGLDAEFFAW